MPTGNYFFTYTGKVIISLFQQTHMSIKMKNFTKALNDANLQAELKAFIDDRKFNEIQDGNHVIIDSNLFLDTAQYIYDHIDEIGGDFTSDDFVVYTVTHYEISGNIHDINSLERATELTNLTSKKLLTVYFNEKSDMVDYLSDQLMKCSY